MKQWLRKIAGKGSGNPYLPPRHLQYVGTADFIKVGRKFKDLFIQWGGLQAHHKVLDIGSGNGRMAYPLLAYLQEGSYLGQEIVAEAVQWCRQAYKDQAHFDFIHADIYSLRYNPQGKIMASEYRFPLADSSFDFVFLTSVFTHMLKADVENYCREIARLLVPGGRAFITCFLINDDRLSPSALAKAELPFQPLNEVSFTTTPDNPESAVAYQQAYFLELLAGCGLKLCEHIHYGRWDKEAQAKTYQDVLIVEKG